MVVYAAFATSSWFLIERVGRRKLFLIGSAGQCISMVIAFACLIPGDAQSAKGASKGGVRSIRAASMPGRRSSGASAMSLSIRSAYC